MHRLCRREQPYTAPRLDRDTVVSVDDAGNLAESKENTGARRPMKMGTTRSPWRYEVVTYRMP